MALVFPPTFCKADPLQLAVASENLYKWGDVNLPYSIMDELPRVSFEELKAAAEWAFDSWAKVCGLKPHYVTAARDARLLIYTAAIDGPNGVLADCELPTPGKKQVKMRLDLGEEWDATLSGNSRKLLLALVLAHEGGHSAGVGHTPNVTKKNIMDATYNPAVQVPGPWDIAEMQRRYGKPVAGTPTNTGGYVGNFLSLLTKLGPIITWLIQNKDQLGPLLDTLKKIFDAFSAQPQRLVENVEVSKDQLREIITHGLAQLKLFSAIFLSNVTWDDTVIRFTEEALKTQWLFDLVHAIINGNLFVSESLLQAALNGDDTTMAALVAAQNP